jgi:hypothetical protein
MKDGGQSFMSHIHGERVKTSQRFPWRRRLSTSIVVAALTSAVYLVNAIARVL